MLNDYDQDGMLPKWAQANGESFEMVGDPADPIIADAYAFGARDFDAGQALRDMVAEGLIGIGKFTVFNICCCCDDKKPVPRVEIRRSEIFIAQATRNTLAL